jgi:hypothetical protein
MWAERRLTRLITMPSLLVVQVTPAVTIASLLTIGPIGFASSRHSRTGSVKNHFDVMI